MIYTKNGDSGFSTNIKNIRYSKDYILFELLGTIDEVSSNLGLAKTECSGAVKDTIEAIQTELILLNSYLAGGKPFDTKGATTRAEQLIDAFTKKVNLGKEFTLSGKTKAGAYLDVSRTVARRVERLAVKAQKIFIVNKEDMSYFNRLSDLLYILARFCDSLEDSLEKAVNYGSKTFQESFDLGQANELCQAVITKARQMGVLVVCAVCDSGGNLMSLSRDDNAYIASVKVATNKAYTSVALKMPTKNLAELTRPGDPLYGVQHQDDKLVVFGGGIPLIRNGNIVGGFGVSGGNLEQDIALADYADKIFHK
jgi:ATP:cob(I)alamin adenosyltransferase